MGAARAVRRRELFRIAAADLVGRLDIEAVGVALTDVAAATVSGGLEAAIARRSRPSAGAPLPTRMAVIAMGRLRWPRAGLWQRRRRAVRPRPAARAADEREASDAALAVALELRRLLALPAPEPPLAIDADLRPEGRQGPAGTHPGLLRQVLRALVAGLGGPGADPRASPVAGDARARGAVHRAHRPAALARRRPRRGRVARGTTDQGPGRGRAAARGAPIPSLHIKLGRGGLADVEWTVQLLQLRHAHAVPELRTTRTMAALEESVRAGLLGAADAATLRAAWRLAGRVRNAVVLQRGRPGTACPRTCASEPVSHASSATQRVRTASWWTTTVASRDAPEPLWNGSSTPEGRRRA